MNNVIAGDKVWVKASGNYNETATIDTAGGVATVIVFEGYTSTPGDNGKVTIDGQSTRADCISALTSANYYLFKNFIFTGATAHGVDAGSAGDHLAFRNCEFTSNGSRGLYGDNDINFVNCEFTNNTERGVLAGSRVHFYGCIFATNGNDHVESAGDSFYYKCLFYGSSDSGDNGIDNASVTVILGCTLDGENVGTNAIVASTPQQDMVIMDNIIYDWVNGITLNSSDHASIRVVGNNLLNSNTNDYVNKGAEDGFDDVTSAPAFTDEASDDYTLGEESPARAAGIKPGGIT
jgi:hypothetical protein